MSKIRHIPAATSAEDIDQLIEALYHRKERVRQAAAWSLGQRRDPTAVPDLLAALHDPDWLVQRNAIHALGKIGDARATPRLCQFLRHADANLRAEILVALGEIGDHTALPMIEGYLTDEGCTSLPKFEGQTVGQVAAVVRGKFNSTT